MQLYLRQFLDQFSENTLPTTSLLFFQDRPITVTHPGTKETYHFRTFRVPPHTISQGLGHRREIIQIDLFSVAVPYFSRDYIRATRQHFLWAFTDGTAAIESRKEHGFFLSSPIGLEVVCKELNLLFMRP